MAILAASRVAKASPWISSFFSVEKKLCARIVIAIALATLAGQKAVDGNQSAVVSCAVKHAAVRVMDEAGQWLSMSDIHAQRGRDEPLVIVVRHRPAHNFTRHRSNRTAR
jgi:hypothetical protein